MRTNVTVRLIGDYSQTVPAHQAIPLALQRAADALQIAVGFERVPTEEVTSLCRPPAAPRVQPGAHVAPDC